VGRGGGCRSKKGRAAATDTTTAGRCSCLETYTYVLITSLLAGFRLAEVFAALLPTATIILIAHELLRLAEHAPLALLPSG
jgi:hypothetical protein